MAFMLGRSAVTDSELGIDIYDPRVEPGHDTSELEYQYRIVVQGRIARIALPATSYSERSGLLSENYTQMSLGGEDHVQWILDVKREVGCADDNFLFLTAFSEGLLMVFMPQSELYTTCHYTLLAEEAILARAGITPPISARRNSVGCLVLAQLVVPRIGDAEKGV